jgi:hypothetical protein
VDPGFKVRGTHLTKLRRAEGGANIFGVFRVKIHDFTPKNHIFSKLISKYVNLHVIIDSLDKYSYKIKQNEVKKRARPGRN